MPVAAVEIEVSLQSYEQEVKDGEYWDLLNSLVSSYIILA